MGATPETAAAAPSAPVPRYLLSDTASFGPAGELLIGGVEVGELADEFGTPLFIYDEEHLRTRCREAVSAFGDGVAYATKAFLCKAMARLAHEEGMMLDVATGGELHIALAAGVPASRCVLHGNNKSIAELEYAVEAGVGAVVIDSFDEIDRLEQLHGATGSVVPGFVRITPGIEAHTHEYISTGQDDSKFGFTVSTGLADQAVARAQASPAVDLVGIHAHIGSQVFAIDALRQSVAVLGELVDAYGLQELSVGGGLGVPYISGEEAPTISQWGRVVREVCDAAGIEARVHAEPGRSIVAQAAITVYRVGTIKHLAGVRTYVSVDGGMSDNPRPVLYGSGYECFVPTRALDPRPDTVRLVGKHCESGDVLIREARVPAGLAVGDLVATPVTGAYGHSMGSNYNKVLRPPVVFVRDGAARQVVRRETFDDLLRTDIG